MLAHGANTSPSSIDALLGERFSRANSRAQRSTFGLPAKAPSMLPKEPRRKPASRRAIPAADPATKHPPGIVTMHLIFSASEHHMRQDNMASGMIAK